MRIPYIWNRLRFSLIEVWTHILENMVSQIKTKILQTKNELCFLLQENDKWFSERFHQQDVTLGKDEVVEFKQPCLWIIIAS